MGDPPFDGFGKAACQLVDQEILRYFPGKERGIPGEELGQVLLEIDHKQAVSIGGYDAADVYLVLLQEKRFPAFSGLVQCFCWVS